MQVVEPFVRVGRQECQRRVFEGEEYDESKIARQQPVQISSRLFVSHTSSCTKTTKYYAPFQLLQGWVDIPA